MTGRATPDREAKHQAELEAENAIMDSLIGCKIVEAVWTDPAWPREWEDHGEYVLVLDDGRTVKFTSRGYDASDVLCDVEEAT